MNSIISFSLYGRAPLYCEGALRNVELAKTVYPGWRCRFYVDDTVPSRYVDVLEQRGAEIVKVAKSFGPMYGRYWRFLLAADPTIDRLIVCDADSRLNLREKAAVDEWISSSKSFHVMRDHPNHRVRILGGMWGGIGGKLRDIEALIDGWGQFTRQGQNQQFMSDVVHPLMGQDYLCHDSIGHFDDAMPFPQHQPLVGTSYVGQVVHIDEPGIAVWERMAALAGRTSPSEETSAAWSRAYGQLANERMLADEECARLRLRPPPGPLGQIWAARRLLPAAFSIRRRLLRSTHDRHRK